MTHVAPESPPPCLAAVTLDARGGGIALVSRLVAEVFRRRWGSAAPVFALMPEGAPTGHLRPGLLARLEFGAQLAVHQAGHECGWVFYAHPSLARVQRHVPRAFRRPYAMFVHGIEAWRELSAEERETYHGAALRLTNSRYTAERVAAANPGLPPLVPCPLALVPGEAPAPAPWRGRPLGPRTVLIVGRMSAAERYKGHDALIEAWPRVRARVPDAVLVCAGEGDDLPRLRRLARRSGPDSVCFTGFTPADQLQALYRGASVFAMPSRGEGFGLVYLEAMSHGVPCIGSVHDAAREIIRDGDTGFLVDQADQEALADRIATLLEDDALRARLGHRGAERVAAEFSFDAFAGRLGRALEGAGLVPPVAAARTA